MKQGREYSAARAARLPALGEGGMQSEKDEEQAIELQPMLEAAMQPPLLGVRRGRATAPPPAPAQQAAAVRVAIVNVALILTWCARAGLGF